MKRVNNEIKTILNILFRKTHCVTNLIKVRINALSKDCVTSVLFGLYTENW